MNRIEMTKRNQRATAIPTTEGDKECLKVPDTQENPKSGVGSKEFRCKQLPEGLYVIYFEGGGELPAELSGAWTSINKARIAIENYKTKRGY